MTQFAHDASGQRLRTLVETPGVSRTITTYPFPQYEVELRQSWEPCSGPCGGGDGGNWVTMATIIRRTYMLGGQAIATRITGDPTNNGLFYLHGDHLGSTSLLTYGSSPGNMVPGTETRYLPYGTHRLAPTTQLTERDYTGQKENLELGLLYYNARFYLPGIGRFASADTIVPDVTNPQNYNRYSYVLNQPIIGTDPDGHCYPICTAIAGGIIGGFVTGVTYYVTTPAAERNWADASLAVGTGVVAGALIGTGVGIVATGAVTVAAGTGASVTAASAMLISAGTGTIVAAETQMIMNGFTGNSFDRTDFAINTIGATAEGAIAPGLGPSRSILASGTIGASQSILSNALHGETINGQEALISGLLGLGSATVGSVVEGASSIGSQPISRGIQPIDFTWQNVQDPILRSWIGNAAAKNSAFASSRTIIRDVVYGIGIKMIQEELP